MATNRKPTSPSAASAPGSTPPIPGGTDDLAGGPPEVAADGDITLDDYEDRQQQRPRLPDLRREKQSFEMSASVATARESATPGGFDGAASFPSGMGLPGADDIANYDPRAAGATAVSAGPKPVPQSAPQVPVSPGLDDLEEFIARTVTDGPVVEKREKVRRPLTLVEKICSAAGAAVVVAAAVWLINAITSEANGKGEGSTPWPDLPMKGAHLTLSEVSSDWRRRTDADRVAQMEVILPVPSLQMPQIIPQVRFTIDPSASSSGFLRFIFKDSEGKPRGDTRVVQVENGKLKDMGKGEIIKGDADGSVYCSYGLLNSAAYRSYEGDDKPRWSVEAAESTAYDARDKDWKILGTFNVRNDFQE